MLLIQAQAKINTWWWWGDITCTHEQGSPLYKHLVVVVGGDNLHALTRVTSDLSCRVTGQ